MPVLRPPRRITHFRFEHRSRYGSFFAEYRVEEKPLRRLNVFIVIARILGIVGALVAAFMPHAVH